MCRICYQEETNEEDMIVPCKCKNTMRYIHPDCWKSSQFHCTICNFTEKKYHLDPKFHINPDEIRVITELYENLEGLEPILVQYLRQSIGEIMFSTPFFSSVLQ